MRRTLASLIALTLLIALAAVPAAADSPTITRTAFDDTRSFPAGTRCGFDVEAARTGTLVEKTWYDESGALVRLTWTWADGKITWTNPANGRSIRTLLAGPFIYEPLGDGTALVTIPGNDQAAVVPGTGFVDGRTGLTRQIWDEATGAVLDVLFEAGHQTAPFPGGCAGLE